MTRSDQCDSSPIRNNPKHSGVCGMVRLLKSLAFGLVLVIAFLGVSASQAQTIQATTLSLISPSTCPSAGCAAGQTVDLRATYDLPILDPRCDQNMLVCLYTPTNWAAESFRIDLLGAVTGASYQPTAANCASVAGFRFIGWSIRNYSCRRSGRSVEPWFPDRTNRDDQVVPPNYAFTKKMPRRYGSKLTRVSPRFRSLPTSAAVYAANDAAACGGFSPCYLNSGSGFRRRAGHRSERCHRRPTRQYYGPGNYAVKSNHGGGRQTANYSRD